MARHYLFAEGQTEQTFADAVLKPPLANCGVHTLCRPIHCTCPKEMDGFTEGAE